MMQISNAFKPRFTSCRLVGGCLVLLSIVLFSAGCSKEPASNENAEKNANSANANQIEQARAAQPLIRPTITGDIERASLAISMARDAVKLDKWQEAISQLQGARKEVDVALTRQTNLRDEFEALKSAIDRAIPALEGRGKDADARLAELQTRLGALKVQTSSVQ
jgi:hypothetical protein